MKKYKMYSMNLISVKSKYILRVKISNNLSNGYDIGL